MNVILFPAGELTHPVKYTSILLRIVTSECMPIFFIDSEHLQDLFQGAGAGQVHGKAGSRRNLLLQCHLVYLRYTGIVFAVYTAV